MSYIVKNTAGNTVAVVPDRHIDSSSTPLDLVGYLVTDYGLSHNQNFIKLLENFANSTAPAHPVEGMLWYDTTSDGLKLYSGGEWKTIGNYGASIGDNPFANGLSGIFHLAITSPAISVLLYFAGGEIVMVMSPQDLTQGSLPASVTVAGNTYPLASRFPFGLTAGTTFAEDTANFRYTGNSVLAEQSHFAGGGDINKPAGWTYIDLGANTVGLMISNGQIICAVSQTTIPYADLPNSITVNVRMDDHSVQTTTIPFKSVYTGGLQAGMTFSSGFTLNGFVTFAVYSSGLANQYAQITSEYQAWVDNNSATAQKVDTLVAKFNTSAGTSSFATAIDTILARTTDNSATAAAITQLHTEFQTALGQSTWSDALTRLSTISTTTSANASELTSLHSAFQASTGQSNFANAISQLWTEATSTTSLSGWSLSLDSNGYVTGVEALNGGASHNYFKVTTSNFIIGDNNIDFIPFQVTGGVVYMNDVVVNKLKVNTAIIPLRVSSTTDVYGTNSSTSGYPAPTTVVLQATFNLPVPGWIEIICPCSQGFNGTSSRPWNFILTVNGTQLPESAMGGTVPGDSVIVAGSYYAASAGDYTVQLLWNANYNVHLGRRSMFIKGYPFTE